MDEWREVYLVGKMKVIKNKNMNNKCNFSISRHDISIPFFGLDIFYVERIPSVYTLHHIIYYDVLRI